MTMFNSLKRIVATAALAVVLVHVAACDEISAPATVEEAPSGEETPDQGTETTPPLQSVFSLSPANIETLEVEMGGTAGNRWCGDQKLWFDPVAELCRYNRGAPPFGQVLAEEGDLRLLTDRNRAAPFIWSGPPGRLNPFPESGDFTIDVRVQVEQLGALDLGVSILEWNPAQTVGSSSPFDGRLMQILARSYDGLRVMLLGEWVYVESWQDPHTYRLVLEDGHYTLFVDEEKVAGPIASEWRPTAVWLGSPSFVPYTAEWSDIRVSEFTVSKAADEVARVSVDIKPGSCPSPVNLKAKGVLPVAILGSAELDVTQIDVSTLRFGETPPAREKYDLEDVATAPAPAEGDAVAQCAAEGADGFMDLTVKFPSPEVTAALAGAASGEERTLTLTGNLLPEFGGTPITGDDVVVVRGN